MGEIMKKVQENYEIDIKRYKKERFFYLIDSNVGQLILKTVKTNPKKIELVSEYNQYFKDNDIFLINDILENKQKKPYIFIKGSTYILSKYQENDIFKYKDFDSSKKLIEKLAKVHKVGKIKLNDLEDGYQFYAKNKLDDFKVKYAEFKRMKKWIDNKSKLKNFEFEFLQNFDYINDSAKKAISDLEESNYTAKYELAIKEKQFTLNSLKDYKIMLQGGEVVFVEIEDFLINFHLHDIEEFFRRYIRNQSFTVENLNELLALYETINKLDDNDKKSLYALLNFPYTFLKVSASYYNQRKTFANKAKTQKFEKALLEKNMIDKFLEQ